MVARSRASKRIVPVPRPVPTRARSSSRSRRTPERDGRARPVARVDRSPSPRPAAISGRPSRRSRLKTTRSGPIARDDLGQRGGPAHASPGRRRSSRRPASSSGGRAIDASRTPASTQRVEAERSAAPRYRATIRRLRRRWRRGRRGRGRASPRPSRKARARRDRVGTGVQDAPERPIMVPSPPTAWTAGPSLRSRTGMTRKVRA